MNITAASLPRMLGRYRRVSALYWQWHAPLHLARDYTLKEKAKTITCPSLITWGENDRLSAHAETLYDALTCSKTLERCYEPQGAGDHCEGVARSLFHQRAFDWLATVFSVQGCAVGSVGT